MTLTYTTYIKSVFSSIALIAVIMRSLIIVRNYYLGVVIQLLNK